jgi:hypothetical protein
MYLALTIIDSFTVKATDAGVLSDLEAGRWFVMDGAFGSAEEIPTVGSTVEVVTPTSERHWAVVEGAEVRHGAAALMFASQSFDELPRLSVVKPRT